EAEDIVQDVFLKLWSKNNEWENIENLEAYCFRATKNLALDRVESLSIRRTENIAPELENGIF
ncbi:MAG TPA: RNA polymerase subunit sigma-70, partial [Porphyromonadaceae bacterium]|nr:RNA polymerase subunit sigma-70 [Porphyromonadaceae bacterium]